MWLSDDEFKIKYRMSREMLDFVCNDFKDCEVFEKRPRGPAQRPVKHQLMILLHFLGQEGHNDSSQRNEFHISRGACRDSRERVVKALLSLRSKFIQWPDSEERTEIAERIESSFFLPNCVGMMDGTLAELAFRPQSKDASDYSGRKYGYSLTIMVINDDRRKIRAYFSGYPGCSHDNRVWKAMDQCQRPELYFSDVEYLLCDTAFEPTNYAIPAYKAQPGFVQDRDEQKFNTCLASPRVISEHVMGVWKGRFPWLRKIRMLVTDEKKYLKRILRYINATVILHNMLIDFGEDISSFLGETLSAIDDAGRLPEEEILYEPVPEGAPKGTRRDQLKELVSERYEENYNYRPLQTLVGSFLSEIRGGSGGFESEYEDLSD